MLTIIVRSFPVLIIEIREKLKVSKGLSLRNIYTNSHTPQFFQPMLLNSKFLHKKVRFKWSLVFSDKQKKNEVTIELHV